jgi:hypothetical protein
MSYSVVVPEGTDPRTAVYLGRASDPAAARSARLSALSSLVQDVPEEGPGGSDVPLSAGEVNNHIHTVYSFSPYTPSMAAWRARRAGLAVAGSVDHDSVGAALEMLSACAILGIGSTVGFEIRVSMAESPFASRKINSPDMAGVAYVTVQGLPRAAIPKAAAFLEPIGRARGARNRRMTAAASALLAGAGYRSIDYDRDVLPLSKAAEGGSVTERHILAAAAQVIIARHGAGPSLVSGIETNLGLKASGRVASWLSDAANPYYLYDLLGLLKTGFLARVFERPLPEECVPASRLAAFAREIGAVAAYAYLGDVADSPTGDKKAEEFEDAFLDELLPWMADAGFQAVAYMPPRNTKAQVSRLRALCGRLGLMEISGVDINSPRQSFNCPEVSAPDMSNLLDTTWALVAHEKLSGLDPNLGLFSSRNPLAGRTLPERVALYAAAGRALDPKNPEYPDILSRFAREWRKA